MSGKFFNKPVNELRIIVAPLDWGIGHTTRCIPIVYALLEAGAQVILAGSGHTEIILKNEFPALPFLHLRGYNVRYSTHKRWLFLKLFSQFPAIKRTIQYEQQWLKKVVQDQKIDAIISDNRFGLYHQDIHTVYLTHQLSIQTGKPWLTKLAQRVHYSYINRFDECWVPDAVGNHNLGALLSHPGELPAVPVSYLGILSRFHKTSYARTNPLLIVLSGPEPQRSIFEKTILYQLSKISAPATLVRGLPGETALLKAPPHVLVYNYLPATELNKLIQQSELVLARAGYSTIMDLAVLQQKAILVPTPGQTEQEYLAAVLTEKKLFYTCNQQDFNLQNAVAGAAQFYKNNTATITRFDPAFVKEWVLKLSGFGEKK